MRRLAFLCLLCSLLLVANGSGRVAPPVDGPPKETPRLTKLKQLTFDRRPSAILKAWAPQPPDDPREKTTKPDPLDEELAVFQKSVTIGNWNAVKAYLAKLPADEGKAAYQQMLQSLRGTPAPGGRPASGGAMPAEMMQPGMGGPMMQFAERNRFAPDDLIGLVAASPVALEKESLESLGGILQQCLNGGNVIEAIVARLKTESSRPKGAALTVRQAARLLASSGHAADAGDFVPALAQAQADKDIEGLNLRAQLEIGLHARDSKLTHLEQAWIATQSALAVPASADKRGEQEDALKCAVELAPKLKEEMGQHWLEQSFTTMPERGMSILATIGSLSSQSMMSQAQDPESRLKTLKLQKTAVEALLKASPAKAREWRDTLTLLAAGWLREAEFSYDKAPTRQANMRRDRFGNYFYWEEEMFGRRMMNQPNQPKPIESEGMLITRPEKAWMDQVSPDLRPKIAITLSQIHLKADEEEKAFPLIEELAKTHSVKARELANEFLRVWTRNHDPNSQRGYRSRYMYFYGFEQRADGIPLTRSKQERNLVELSGWVARIRKLPIGEVDQDLLAKAFTTCHSSAEVYRSEAIEKVFGPIGGLKPKTLSSLAQQMRGNLAGLWRRPEPQQTNKTNRKMKDIQVEVARGYEVARATVENAMKKFPDDWSLVQARAALIHDEAAFHQELSKSTSFVSRRAEAYAGFARAAKLYAARVKELPEEEQTTDVFDQWFYASLGACDLGQINEDKVPDLKEPAKVRQALLALPGELAEKHREKFASALFSRMSSVKPVIKYRYLKAGFEIVGDHPQASEAKKVFDYYKDLVNEIKLETKIDGNSVVGHKESFGVYVFLRHTRDIERESNGFGRYLQNQNSNTRFYWNYGRPTTDYRDRFQTAAAEALKEHFDVVSVTFETEKVHSRATDEYGWRITPYAYLLLKPKGPQVDKLPPLRIDLDFLDTSGYVVLPIESPAVPLDARLEKGEMRPVEKIEITQTLDERQADKGKLLLEIKAKARGLVPDLDKLVDLSPADFEIVKTTDQGVSVMHFAEDADKIAVESERTWMVELKARDDQARAPETFRFAGPKDSAMKMVYQRFQDADLVPAEIDVALEQQYGGRRLRWLWWSAGGAAVVVGLAVAAVLLLRRKKKLVESRWKLPENLTPFTTIGLLEQIHHEGKLTQEQREQVRQTIRQLERHYFASDTNGDGRLDLKTTVEGWLQRAG